ncbi:MAG: Bug family tripartite tricarboxylate transporter substrate binding protein [Burkholderiales bacterium]
MAKAWSILFALACAVTSQWAAAQAYPNRPIRMIIPFPAGSSSNDILGRQLAQRLSESMGQQVVVDNRAGASGHIGGEMVARAAPDGYTILLGVNGALAIGPSVYDKLAYDPVRDLAPIARFVLVPYALYVHPALPAKNLRELIALAKARPGQLNFASSGSGGTPHLCGELLKSTAGIDLVHVPYKGGAPAVVDLVAGQVQMYCAGVTAVLPLVKAGKLRALSTATPSRAALLPDVQSAAESGLPGFDVASWIAFFAPAKTPEPIIRRLYDEIAKITNDPEMQKSIVAQGAEPALMDPAQLSAYLKAEIAKWAKVVKAANVKPD